MTRYFDDFHRLSGLPTPTPRPRSRPRRQIQEQAPPPRPARKGIAGVRDDIKLLRSEMNQRLDAIEDTLEVVKTEQVEMRKDTYGLRRIVEETRAVVGIPQTQVVYRDAPREVSRERPMREQRELKPASESPKPAQEAPIGRYQLLQVD